MAWVSTALTIIKAIPAVRSAFELLVALYIKQEIARMKKENVEVIKKAFIENDQREIERSMGSSRAGLPSGNPGSETRDSLPGVE